MAHEFKSDDSLHQEAARFTGSEATVLWMHESAIADIYRELHAFAVDEELEEVTIVRGWQSNGTPMVSVDIQIPLSVLTGKFDPSAFRRGGFADPDSPEAHIEKAFAREVGGDVALLWKYADNRSGSFIARVATVGNEEEIVAGHVSHQPESDTYSVDVGFRAPLSELGAKAPAYGR